MGRKNKKKTGTAAPAADVPAAEEQWESVPAAVADEGEWEQVVDHKKQRQRDRAALKRTAEEQRKAEARARSVGYLGGPAKADSTEAKAASASSGLKSAPATKSRHAKKKKKKADDGERRPSNEKELVELLVRLLEGNAGVPMDLPTMGNRVQAIVGASWNKLYKARYGTLASFVGARSEFSVSGGQIRVAGAADPTDAYREAVQRVEAEEEVRQRKREKKKKAKRSAAAETTPNGAGAGAQSDDEDEAGSGTSASPCLRLGAVAALLGASALLTLVVIQGGDVAAVQEQVRQLIGA